MAINDNINNNTHISISS